MLQRLLQKQAGPRVRDWGLQEANRMVFDSIKSWGGFIAKNIGRICNSLLVTVEFQFMNVERMIEIKQQKSWASIFHVCQKYSVKLW